MNDTPNTIDAAVEQLIQVPDTSTEDATEEVVEETSEEEVVEPTEQDESEETLEFDDEELSDIDFDSDDVEEVLEESTEKDSLHTVKINGKEENWTLDQLKQSAKPVKVTSTRGCKRLRSLKKLTKSKLLPSPNSNNNSWSFSKSATNWFLRAYPTVKGII